MIYTADLSTFSADQLAIAFGLLDGKARVAASESARSRAMNRREAVADEATRRGFVIRCTRNDDLSDPHFMCGRPADFAPDHEGADTMNTTTRNLAKPLESLVNAYGAEYGEKYEDAFASLPDGETTEGQQVRAEVAHWFAMDARGFLGPHVTLAGCASGYAQQQAHYGAPNCAAAGRYADRVREFFAEADRLTGAITARTGAAR